MTPLGSPAGKDKLAAAIREIEGLSSAEVAVTVRARSGSYRDVSVPSSRRVLLAADRPQRAGYSAAPAAAPSSASRQTRKKNEWRGNMVLILAIAMLVGVATFVVVRERVEEQRRTAPSESR